jgi:hypothetical protein
VWAASGSSLFRWKDSKAEEFSIAKDPVRFPARSDMTSRVLEVSPGKIWVICSNEIHRHFNGQQLAGGVIEWIGAGFVRLDYENASNWFLTSVTPLTDGSAIAGSTTGFARFKDVKLASFNEDLGDLSYRQLRERKPGLWLGSRGARIGSDTCFSGLLPESSATAPDIGSGRRESIG